LSPTRSSFDRSLSFRNYSGIPASVEILFRATPGTMSSMADFLSVVGIVVFAVAMIALIKALEHV
jgi:hypothetical protein